MKTNLPVVAGEVGPIRDGKPEFIRVTFNVQTDHVIIGERVELLFLDRVTKAERINKAASAALDAPLPPKIADTVPLTPKEAHLFDVYEALGIKWGDDPFKVIEKLRQYATENLTSAPIDG